MKQVFRLISFIGHPAFVFPLLMLLNLGEAQWEMVAMVFGCSFVLPFLYFLYLYRTGAISNFDITERKQRYRVFGATLLGLLLSLVGIYFLGEEAIFFEFLRLIGIAIVLVLVNFKIKVSIHAALVTVLCFTLVQNFALTPWIFVLVPLVAASRLVLKRHAPLELLLGVVIPSVGFLLKL